MKGSEKVQKYRTSKRADNKDISEEDYVFNPVKTSGIIILASIIVFIGVVCATTVYSKSSLNSHKNTTATPEEKKYTGLMQEYGDFKYKYIFTKTDDSPVRQPVAIQLMSYTGEGKKISIPEEIDLLPVTTISNSCFAHTSIETINIPISIKVIDSFAFYQCENLKEVLFDETATTDELLIKDSAFRDCINIGTICFPYLQLDIKSTAFMGCSSLKFLVFNDMCALKIGVGAFQGCALEKVELPRRTKVIEDNAFKNCSIKHLDIPDDCEVGKNITSRNNNAYRVTTTYSNRKNNNTTTKENNKYKQKDEVKTPTTSKRRSWRDFISNMKPSADTTSTTEVTTTEVSSTTNPDVTSVTDTSTEINTTAKSYYLWPFF